MNLEIHKPELVRRVNARIQTGQFHDADELLEKALDALDERTTAIPARDTRTGADLIAALQSSPYRELEIEPPRVRLTNVRDVVL
jgi:Arc/MetJ-type ribon-helix-helix transcriptional regulator